MQDISSLGRTNTVDSYHSNTVPALNSTLRNGVPYTAEPLSEQPDELKNPVETHSLAGAIAIELPGTMLTQQLSSCTDLVEYSPNYSFEQATAQKAEIVAAIKLIRRYATKPLKVELIGLIYDFYKGDGVKVLNYGDKVKFIKDCLDGADDSIKDFLEGKRDTISSTIYHYFEVAAFYAKCGIEPTVENMPSFKAVCKTAEKNRDYVWNKAKMLTGKAVPDTKTINEVIKTCRETKNRVVNDKLAVIKKARSKATINKVLHNAQVLLELNQEDEFKIKELTESGLIDLINEIEQYQGTPDYFLLM